MLEKNTINKVIKLEYFVIKLNIYLIAPVTIYFYYKEKLLQESIFSSYFFLNKTARKTFFFLCACVCAACKLILSK